MKGRPALIFQTREKELNCWRGSKGVGRWRDKSAACHEETQEVKGGEQPAGRANAASLTERRGPWSHRPARYSVLAAVSLLINRPSLTTPEGLFCLYHFSASTCSSWRRGTASASDPGRKSAEISLTPVCTRASVSGPARRPSRPLRQHARSSAWF